VDRGRSRRPPGRFERRPASPSSPPLAATTNSPLVLPPLNQAPLAVRYAPRRSGRSALPAQALSRIAPLVDFLPPLPSLRRTPSAPWPRLLRHAVFRAARSVFRRVHAANGTPGEFALSTEKFKKNFGPGDPWRFLPESRRLLLGESRNSRVDFRAGWPQRRRCPDGTLRGVGGVPAGRARHRRHALPARLSSAA